MLREGASALYGSDAIAGVINFITKKNYQGAEVQGNFDRPQEAGGGSGEADFTFGHGDLKSDGYNFMVTASYSKQQELRATQRAFSAEGFDPARGVPNTNYSGIVAREWSLDANGNVLAVGLSGLCGQSATDRPISATAHTGIPPRPICSRSPTSFPGWLSFTKALPANNTLQLQYFYTQSEVNGYSGPMFYDFQMDPASPYFPTGVSADMRQQGAANCSSRGAGSHRSDRRGLDRPEQQPLRRHPQYRAAGSVDVLRQQRRLGLRCGPQLQQEHQRQSLDRGHSQ